MDKQKLKELGKRYGGGAFLIFCGAVLILFPNHAVSLVTKLMAWVLVATGVYNVIKLILTRHISHSPIWTVLYLIVGGYMLSHPLIIADMMGRILGLFLVSQGVSDMTHAIHPRAKTLGMLTLIAGIVLVILPRTLTDTLLGLVGLVLIIVGIINLLGKSRRSLPKGDPNIIDADE